MSYGNQLKNTQPQLKAFVKSKVFNEADASDIVQTVNEVALNKEEVFDEGRCFEAWIIGIAKYQILNYFKKHKKAPTHVSINFYTSAENEASEPFLSDIPFAELVKDERRLLRLKILGRLTKKQKKIFSFICDGLTVKEIAQELETSSNNINTAKSRLIKRAKKLLKELDFLNNYDYRSNRQY
tara:strand:+ start:874 stop:1422 length:549 start_codon:yes stop_codon:yes gene_type:complete